MSSTPKEETDDSPKGRISCIYQIFKSILDETNQFTTSNVDIDNTKRLRLSFRQMKKKRVDRKTSLQEPAIFSIKRSLEVTSPPPPSPSNEPKVEEVIESVKEILSELSKKSLEETKDPDEKSNISEIERPVDVVGPTALKSLNRSSSKNSTGAKVAFIEPVPGKKQRRKTQKITFENMKEVQLMDESFFFPILLKISLFRIVMTNKSENFLLILMIQTKISLKSMRRARLKSF
jgi:hypothetical protein